MRFESFYDLTKITDSMQIDSDELLAEMEKNGFTATLEVRGDVKVWWNERAGDPMEGECYTYPSEFPEKLKQLIAGGYTADEGHWTLDPRLYISENNWFELFVSEPGYETIPDAEVVDVEGLNDKEVFDLLYEAIEERIASKREDAKNYEDLSIISICEQDHIKYVWFEGYGYKTDEEGNTPYRFISYSNMAAPLKDVIAYPGGIERFESDSSQVIKQDITDLSEEKFLRWYKDENGQVLKKITTSEITDKTPNGTYILISER